MSLKLKVIKTKAFEAKGEKHTYYTAAYKGRLFGISTLRMPAEDINVTGDVLTLSGEVEVLKSTSTDPLDGTTKIFLDLVPKAGLTLAEF